MKFLYTVDVEVWCDGWKDLDRQFPAAFRQYIYGPTKSGQFGLPYQLDLLTDHGIKGVFFVEPLFALRFGQGMLDEIVGLIQGRGHEVQLHLHTEWADEALEPFLPSLTSKRQHLRYFSQQEQQVLIAKGLELIQRAGATQINAFRAGSFAFNRDTLPALKALGIAFDSSYNASMFGADSGVMPGVAMVEPALCDGVYEYPIAVFNDGTRALRHVQLSACSSAELEWLIEKSLQEGRRSFVMLSHGFELMNRGRDGPDLVAAKRLHSLCRLLEQLRADVQVVGFNGLEPQPVAVQPPPLRSPLWKTGPRMMEQVYRRRFG